VIAFARLLSYSVVEILMIYTEPNQALRSVDVSMTFERDAATAFSLIRSYAAASFSYSGLIAVLGLIIIGVGVTGPA
jgi:hypothetical protein